MWWAGEAEVGGGWHAPGPWGPTAGNQEASASKPSHLPGGRMNTVSLKRLWCIFLSPHLTLSTQSPPVCGLWGDCTGAAYRSDWKERRRKKIPSNGRANPLSVSKDPRTQAHTQAGFETASHERHGGRCVCAKTHVCTETHVQTQRQLAAVSRERLSRVPTHTCGTGAKDTGPRKWKGPEVPAQAQGDTVP